MNFVRLRIAVTGLLATTASIPLSPSASAQCLPRTLTTVGPINGNGITISGDIAVSAHAGSVELFDISNPSSPTPLSTISTAFPTSTAIIGDTLCVNRSIPGAPIDFYDISDPTSPIVVSAHAPTLGQGVKLSAYGSLLFVAHNNGGVTILDVATPSSPTVISETALSDISFDVEFDGSYIYVAGLPSTTILDATNLASPTIVAAIPSVGTALAIDGDLAYIGGTPALRTYDITDRSNPVLLDELAFGSGNSVIGLRVSDGVVYGTARFNGLLMIDVSDPADLQLISQVTLPNFTSDVAGRGEVLYVTNQDLGVVVMDIAVCPRAIEYCPATTLNSAGLAGTTVASGGGFVGANDFTLHAQNLPTGAMGYFLGSQSRLSIPNIGGSQGTLCIGVPITRFVSLAGVSDASGSYDATLDLENIPPPLTHQPLVGETWNFQFWYRDMNPTSTSNMTSAVEVRFW